MNLLPIDELNRIEGKLKNAEITGEKISQDELLDDVLDFLLFAYFSGSQDAAESLGIVTEPSISKAQEAINLKIAGKTYKDRITEYSESGTAEEILRVIDTDMTRIYNTGVLDTARGVATSKTWVTMNDEKVRDTHSPLEGVTIPIDAEFYTWDSDHALQPGGFEKPENNCNCRCVLRVS